MERVDVVVVGAGINGAAAASALAARGHEVVVLEQFVVGHDRGSSHGHSRIFRFAYADPAYVALAQSALRGWRELEARCNERLVEQTGGADHGDPREVHAVAAALDAAQIPHEVVPGEEAARRYPGMRFDGDVLLSPDSGRVDAERAVRSLLRGVDVHEECAVERIESAGSRAIVHAAHCSYDAGAVVVAAGAWMRGLVGDAAPLPPLVVTEEHVMHFAPRDGDATAWPSFIHYRRNGAAAVYGLETPGEGVKVAEHHAGRVLDDASARDPEPDPARLARVRDYVEEWLSALDAQGISVTTCLYTSTPTHDFVVERHGPIVVVSACSGHAFKFAPAIGENVADLIETREPA